MVTLHVSFELLFLLIRSTNPKQNYVGVYIQYINEPFDSGTTNNPLIQPFDSQELLFPEST